MFFIIKVWMYNLEKSRVFRLRYGLKIKLAYLSETC